MVNKQNVRVDICMKGIVGTSNTRSGGTSGTEEIKLDAFFDNVTVYAISVSFVVQNWAAAGEVKWVLSKSSSNINSYKDDNVIHIFHQNLPIQERCGISEHITLIEPVKLRNVHIYTGATNMDLYWTLRIFYIS